MHLHFSITSKAKYEPELKNWTPIPPLTWASSLRCHSNGREDVSLNQFNLRWKEIFKKSVISSRRPNVEGVFHVGIRFVLLKLAFE